MSSSFDSSSSSSPVPASPVDALAQLAPPAPAPDLWARVTASLDGGVRPLHDPFATPATSLLPDDDEDTPAAPVVVARRSSRWWARAAAVVAVTATGALMLRPTSTLEAGMISGAMVLSPALPKLGERVQVRYTAGALLGRPAVLRLRARVRTVHGQNYVRNEPVVALGTLRQTRGNEYTGSFVLPDSIVFAALAVEDTAAREVDDFGGRTWEVLRASDTGEPTLASLEQRTNDMMGRSWEQGMLGVRRMLTLYPDSVSSWRWLNTYESWMALETDSTKAENRKQLMRFSARDLTNPSLTAEQLSDMVWFSRSLDSTVGAPWMARLQRDAPGHSTAIYLRGLATLQAMWAARIDTAQALTQLESLWPTVTPDRQLWLAEYGADLSRRDEVAANRWSARLLAASHDETARRDAAERLLKLPALRARGEEALRALLVVTTVERERRLLDESAAAHAARVDRSRRATLAVLGQALAADGALKAARDTLTLATAGGWIPGAFATLGDVRLALGDTSGAVDAWAHTAVDPNTTTARRAALDSAVRRVGQRSRWDGAQQDARRVLAARVMERATNRHVDDVPLLGLDGRSHQLSSLRGDRGTVVVFWSHECGYAVEAVPELQALSARLAKRGVPMLLVADAARMTPALMATLKEKQVTMPVYLDATGRATATFNNWGTPTLYVLDSKGRVAFPSARAMSQVLLYAEAVLGSAP